MKKIKYSIAIIGCGRIVGHHIGAIEEIDGLSIAAVCDIDENKAKAYSEEFSIPFFQNYRTMLSSIPEVDIVVIATPSGMHYEHAKEIIEKYNKHVVVEKPTFMRHDQLNEIYSIASKKNLSIFPVFQNRFNSAVKRVKTAIDNNELGDIRILNVRLRWCRPQRYYDMSPWRGTYSHDGGAITNQGIHHIDLLRYLGGELEEVNSITRTLGSDIEVEDSMVSIFSYSSGAIGSLEITTSARPDDFEASISIIGSRGLAQIGGVAVNELQVFTPKPSDCIQFSDNFEELEGRSKIYGKGHIEFYQKVANYFISGSEFTVDEEDCFNTISLLHSFYVSAEEKRWIKVSDRKFSSNLGKENDNISDLYRI